MELAILWHMHQPMYRDPRSGDFILPWVRLHAARAYYDMARALEPHPTVRVHVNLVPSLLDQLEASVAGTARDLWLELTEKPAADLDPAEREQVWARFFMVDWATEVFPLPRYHELLLRRGTDLTRVDLGRLARDGSNEDLRDLQVLFNLAWTGFSLRAEDEGLQELLARGRGFREEDKRTVLAAQQRAAAAVVPAFRALAARGQIELTTTPHYHPILPLLIDSDSARAGLPHSTLPTPFRHPDDARAQIASALASHERRFGERPVGMWPAEGSVSEAAAELIAEAGIRWIATDEGVLLHSLDDPQRSAIHYPHRLQTKAGPLDLVFRDRGLSDLIGFTYARKAAKDAVADLLGHLRQIAAAPRSHDGEPLVGLILDGENPWEHYPHSGRDFLHTLYAALSAEDSPARTVRLCDALPDRQKRKLSRLHAGSWIDANFRIWIGHPEDVRGWEALGKVRAALDEAPARGVSEDKLTRARQAIFIAEGSDWFWWYGDDFSTENAAEFDALFRGYLALACDLLGVSTPPEIAVPISAQARRRPPADLDAWQPPTSLLAPRIDGRENRFGEWQGAGRLRAGRGRGAMAQSALRFEGLRFGFGREQLFLRMDPSAGLALELTPVAISIALRHRDIDWLLTTASPCAAPAPLYGAAGARLGLAAFVDRLEVAVPLGALGIATGDRVDLSVTVFEDGSEVQRLPASGELALVVAGPDFDRVHWKV